MEITVMEMGKALRVMSAGLLWIAGCAQDPDTPTPESPEDQLQAEIDAELDDAAVHGFSGVALVIIDGETVFVGGYGFADRQADVPNMTDTAFDFGSVMKDLTAAAIFKLEDEGALATSDALTDFFEDVPEDKAEITVLQLVQHSAGLDEYHDTEGDFEAMTREEARSNIFAQELLFEPGSDEAYSNSGYTLLADIIEEASGRSFTQYVHEELLAPAGMADSGFYRDPVWDRVDTAIGYDDQTFEDNDPASWPLTWALMGNGGLVATVPDIAKWLGASRDGSVLSERAFEHYESEYLEPSAIELEGKAVYAFAGAGDYGLGGVAVACPELNSSFVIATNTYTEFDIEAFASDFAMLLFGER